MKHNGRTKILSLLLALAMILSLVPGMGLTAFASGGKETWDSDVTVTESRTIDGYVMIINDITLTINEGVTLTVKDSLEAEGATITVKGEGTLDVTGSEEYYAVKGNLVVDGATVNARGGSGKKGTNNNPPAGVYEGTSGNAGANGINGNVTVKSGCLNVYGGNGGNGGSSETVKTSGGNGGNAVSGNVTVEGGTFNAVGGKGGNGGELAMGGYGNNGSNGKAVTGTIIGEIVMESDDNNTWTAVSGGSSSKRFVRGEVASTAYAGYVPAKADDADALAAKVVKFNGYDWYLIEDNSTSETEGTVTLFAKDTIGSSRFDNSKNVYSGSMVQSYLDKLTAEGGAFADVADAIVSTDLEDVTVTGAKIWLLSKDEVITAYKLSTALNQCSNDWWLRTPASSSYVVFVNGKSGSVDNTGNLYMNTYGVRPALQLDLSKVEFDSATNTFAVPVKDPVPYMAWDETDKTVKDVEGGCTDYTVVTDSTAAFEDGKWYVVNGEVSVASRITVTGTANLILCDGAKLTASKGITTHNATLNIYPGSTGETVSGTGELIAVASQNSAGIGGTIENGRISGGTVTIHGGKVTAQGNNAAGIGGYNHQGGTVTIYGGDVTAKGGNSGAGIGGGNMSGGGTVAIYGGTVTTIGGDSASKGIGSGFVGSSQGTLTLGDGVTMLVSSNNNTWSAYDGSTRTQYMKSTYNPHTHNFTYSADGATITATCGNDGCDLTDSKATLTIAAPALTTYGGTGSAAATLTGLTDFNSATGKTIAATDIKYVGRDGTTYTESTTAPTNAGKYTAKITVEEKTASVNYEIAKVNPTYTVPTGLYAECGDTLADVTLPDGWKWADGTQSVGSVGKKTFKATFTPADTVNYNTVNNVDVTVKVSKAAGKEAVISTDTMSYDDISICIEGVAGQEYVIVPKGTTVTDADWEESVKPDPERDNWVFFENLKSAAEYEIYTRTAETETAYASDAVKANVYTTLSCVGWNYDGALVGAKLTVEAEPETEGLTYKWYQDDVTEDDEGALHHSLTEIPGATDAEYTFRTEDVGKYITVKIFAGESEVGDVTTMEPVALGGTVIFDSTGGSEIEPLTDVAYQTKIKAPAEPLRKGYAFAGWYWDEEYEMPFDFDNDVITWNETTLYAKWTPADYSVTAVAGLTGDGKDEWTKGGKEGVAITVKLSGNDDSFDRFLGVKLDGKDLVKDADYTVEKGSAIVTLKPETLEKLSVGEHTVTVLFNNGEVSTTLTILEPAKEADNGAASPKTGDVSNAALWMALMALSLLGIAAALLWSKRKNALEK